MEQPHEQQQTDLSALPPTGPREAAADRSATIVTITGG